jgi:hypothetical protein
VSVARARQTAWLAFALVAMLSGCQRSSGAAAEPSSVTGTDVERVSKWVQLPKAPAAVRWRTALLAAPSSFGPTDWELVAVLSFSEGDADAVMAALAPQPASLETWSPTAAAWLTPGVVSSLASASFGDAGPLGRSPLLNGWAARLPGSGTVVLRLYTQ